MLYFFSDSYFESRGNTFHTDLDKWVLVLQVIHHHYIRHMRVLNICWLNPSRRWRKPVKTWGVRVRPWCWEVAGPWTAAAWFTTPAAPPHRASRWRADGGSGFPLERWEAVPSHCVLPGGSESALPLPLSPNLRYICDSCEKRTCKLDLEETIRGEETWGNFLWVPLVKFSS